MDKIDILIDMLNAAIPQVPFDRDAVNVDRPDEWGAVELRGASGAQWADGHMIDQKFRIDILLCVEDLGAEWVSDVQDVLNAFDDQVDYLGYSLPERAYLQEIDRAAWRWQCAMFGPLEEVPAMEEEGGQDG